MFIKAHVRGGYRAAAHYLDDKGENEVSRLVYISDPDAKNLDEAFHNMWLVASATKAEKPLFHFSINPFKDERLTEAQVKHIAAAYAAKCNMDISKHQHVIVEHIKDGRQHFHVILNRVNQETGRAIDPGLYKKKAKECCREMEIKLGLKRLMPSDKKHGKHSAHRRMGRVPTKHIGRASRTSSVYRGLNKTRMPNFGKLPRIKPALLPKPKFYPAPRTPIRKRRKKDENMPDSEKPVLSLTPEEKALELLIWAWENHRPDILVQFGIHLPPDYEF